MITDRLMSVGEWSLGLVPNAPTATRRAFDWGRVVFVTPTRFDRSVSFATLKSTAVYAGLVFRMGHGLRKFGGPGLLGYLQTGKGEGTNDAAAGGVGVGFGPVAYGAFLSALEAKSILNGLTTGTGHSATATTATVESLTFSPPTKSLLDTVGISTGNEYRVLPSGAIDYGVSTSLFRSTPTVALAPGMRGADAGMRVPETTQWSVDRNIDNYRNTATVVTNDDTYSSSAFATTGVQFDKFDSSGFMAAYISDRATLQTNDHTEADNTATAMANIYASAAMDIRCSVREYCLPRFVTPGDWIWVYSVEDDLTDTANQVVFQGQTLFPKKVRCVGYTYPVESGMGVYVYNTTTSVVTDVSDYVAWETGQDTSLELDSKPLSIFDAATRSVLL